MKFVFRLCWSNSIDRSMLFQNEKTAVRAAVFKGLVRVRALSILGNWSIAGNSHRKSFQFSQQWRFCSRLFPRNSSYPRLSSWRFSVPERIGLQEIVAVRAWKSGWTGRLCKQPNVQRHTSARLHLQAGMRKQALNALRSTERFESDSKLIGGGVLRSVQRQQMRGNASSLRVRHGKGILDFYVIFNVKIWEGAACSPTRNRP